MSCIRIAPVEEPGAPFDCVWGLPSIDEIAPARLRNVKLAARAGDPAPRLPAGRAGTENQGSPALSGRKTSGNPGGDTARMATEDRRRAQMVEHDIASRGVRDPRVLDAMRAVPREAFVPEDLRQAAFEDHPLPIGDRQTISQPYIVALMCEAVQLRASDRALEIGTGSGYSAAVLGRLASEVETVERIARLASRAAAQLARLGVTNVHVHCGDGTLGWPDGAPYDAIVVTAGGPSVPKALLEQLAPGGRLVMPVGTGHGWQDLVRVTRSGVDDFRQESLGDVAFVPLIGAQGWPEA